MDDVPVNKRKCSASGLLKTDFAEICLESGLDNAGIIRYSSLNTLLEIIPGFGGILAVTSTFNYKDKACEK